MNRFKQWILYSVVCRFYWRLNAILGYLILLPIDWMITKTTNQTWQEAHGRTMEAVKRSWYKY